MKKVLGYLQGFIFFKPTFSGGSRIRGRWLIVAVHPKWSITWHWCLDWTAPWVEKGWRFPLLSLGFGFSSQDLMLREDKHNV